MADLTFAPLLMLWPVQSLTSFITISASKDKHGNYSREKSQHTAYSNIRCLDEREGWKSENNPAGRKKQKVHFLRAADGLSHHEQRYIITLHCPASRWYFLLSIGGPVGCSISIVLSSMLTPSNQANMALYNSPFSGVEILSTALDLSKALKTYENSASAASNCSRTVRWAR